MRTARLVAPLTGSVLLLALGTITEAGSGAAPDQGVVASLGAGLSTPIQSSSSLAALVSLTFNRGDRLLGLRLVDAGEFSLWGPASSRREVALLVGRRWRGRSGYVQTSTGLARLSSRSSRRGVLDEHRALGLPLEAKAVLSNGSAGLGLAGFMHLSRESPFAGAALTLEFGRLRN